MDYFKIIMILLSFIICAIGVTIIFDARRISAKFFSFSDKNEGSKTLKLIGFALSIIGALIIIFIV